MNKWIGRRGKIDWPLRSCNLTPRDFAMWGIIKKKVFQTKPDNIEYLKELITDACESSTRFATQLFLGVDVWWGVWQCTHAKLAPLTPHPLVWDRYYRPASGQRGERFEAGNLSAHISSLLFKCADDATTLSLRFGIDQDLRPRW